MGDPRRAAKNGDVICQQLQRYHFHDRLQQQIMEAILAGEINFYVDSRHALEHEFAHYSGMAAGPAAAIVIFEKDRIWSEVKGHT